MTHEIEWCAEPKQPREFCTSDSHFGHKLMARLRGFYAIKDHEDLTIADAKNLVRKAINKMDETLIANWNAVVCKNDVVYHLGDFSFHSKGETINILKRLNGRIRFIRGNHDGVIKGEVLAYFEWQKSYYEAKAPGGEKIILSHYPFETWNKSHHGSWHLHGHCHGSLRTTRDIKRIDVGVDTNDLKPYSMEEIEAIMAKRGHDAVDHHTKRTK